METFLKFFDLLAGFWIFINFAVAATSDDITRRYDVLPRLIAGVVLSLIPAAWLLARYVL